MKKGPSLFRDSPIVLRKPELISAVLEVLDVDIELVERDDDVVGLE